MTLDGQQTCVMKLSQRTTQIRCKSGYKSIALELEEMGFNFAVKKQGITDGV
jgi:hypothetical protein